MTLELYEYETCPYCQRVLRYLKESGRTDVVLKNVHTDRRNLDTLIRVGGMDQVPCLFIDGEPLYESLDIIDWLKDQPQ